MAGTIDEDTAMLISPLARRSTVWDRPDGLEVRVHDAVRRPRGSEGLPARLASDVDAGRRLRRLHLPLDAGRTGTDRPQRAEAPRGARGVRTGLDARVRSFPREELPRLDDRVGPAGLECQRAALGSRRWTDCLRLRDAHGAAG